MGRLMGRRTGRVAGTLLWGIIGVGYYQRQRKWKVQPRALKTTAYRHSVVGETEQ